jgi:hypothetical protein
LPGRVEPLIIDDPERQARDHFPQTMTPLHRGSCRTFRTRPGAGTHDRHFCRPMSHDGAKMRHDAPPRRIDSAAIAVLAVIGFYKHEYGQILLEESNTDPVLSRINRMDRD